MPALLITQQAGYRQSIRLVTHSIDRLLVLLHVHTDTRLEQACMPYIAAQCEGMS